jgi:RNA polymerase sigma-70 factor, ECF subfamily
MTVIPMVASVLTKERAMTMIQTNCSTRHGAIPTAEVAMYAEITRSRPVVSKDRNPPVTTETSDDELLRGVAAGKTLAMQALFARHQVRVYRFILRHVGNAAIAEELTGDVFLDVWRQADRFEGRSAVTTWLLSIARYKALSLLRRRSDEELDTEAAVAIEDPSDDPELALEKKDKSAIIRKCMTGLSAEHREIIDLVYYHEKSVGEVAEIVGIPENTVKTRMFYARKKLAGLLAAEGIVSFAA